MKEKEFIDKINGITLDYVTGRVERFIPKVEIPVYYTLDDDDNVILDFESMREEFEDKLNKLSGLLPEDRDE